MLFQLIYYYYHRLWSSKDECNKASYFNVFYYCNERSILLDFCITKRVCNLKHYATNNDMHRCKLFNEHIRSRYLMYNYVIHLSVIPAYNRLSKCRTCINFAEMHIILRVISPTWLILVIILRNGINGFGYSKKGMTTRDFNLHLFCESIQTWYENVKKSMSLFFLTLS